MGIFDAIAGALKAVAAIFGYRQQRDAEQNSPQMQANAAADTRERIAQKAAEDVAAKTLDQLRKDAAEN